MKFKLWKDTKGQWRWTLVARNGKTIADSAEAYRRKQDARRMCERINYVFPIVELPLPIETR